MAKTVNQTKRLQVDKTQTTMLSIVVVASIITMFALVASKSFFSQATYLNRVSSEKEKAVKQLKANTEAVSKLVESYGAFSQQNPNIIGGNSKASGERDGDNGRLILDALPSEYDFPALTTSLEKLLTGYTINSIAGTDDVAAQTSTESNPVAMPFTLDVNSDYSGIQKLSATFEKSIRPFQILSLQLSGTNGNLQASISAQTFYQPERNLNIETKVIR